MSEPVLTPLQCPWHEVGFRLGRGLGFGFHSLGRLRHALAAEARVPPIPVLKRFGALGLWGCLALVPLEGSIWEAASIPSCRDWVGGNCLCPMTARSEDAPLQFATRAPA